MIFIFRSCVFTLSPLSDWWLKTKIRIVQFFSISKGPIDWRHFIGGRWRCEIASARKIPMTHAYARGGRSIPARDDWPNLFMHFRLNRRWQKTAKSPATFLARRSKRGDVTSVRQPWLCGPRVVSLRANLNFQRPENTANARHMWAKSSEQH